MKAESGKRKTGIGRLAFAVHHSSPASRPASRVPHPPSPVPRCAYTLVELLISTVLALIVMLGVVQVFALIGQGISDSRSTLEMSEQLRSVAAMLKNDLGGVTVVMNPPRSPEDAEGYFEYTEGPMGPAVPYTSVAFNTGITLPPGGNPPDTTVGDVDDMLVFTTRSRTEPFVGRCATTANGFAESSDAEVAWFVRGRTLYRRVLLIAPSLLPAPRLPGGALAAGFYAGNDISVRMVTDASGNQFAVGNTLADLTMPANRFAHQPQHGYTDPLATYDRLFPSHPHFYASGAWAQYSLATSGWGPQWTGQTAAPGVGLMLPTLRECSSNTWVAGGPLPMLALSARGSFDAWANPHPWTGVDQFTGFDQTVTPPVYRVAGTLTAFEGSRVAEDVVLNDVIGFDVKAWDPRAPVLQVPVAGGGVVILVPGDPGYITALNSLPNGATIVSYGAYVDLNYGYLANPAGRPYLLNSAFAGPGDSRSLTYGADPTSPTTVYRPAVYDSWSTHYGRDGLRQNHVVLPGGLPLPLDAETNGFDDNGDGVVDDAGEIDAPAPYAVPLRGIQVKIRCFEPTSRQVREVTVIQEFVTK